MPCRNCGAGGVGIAGLSGPYLSTPDRRFRADSAFCLRWTLAAQSRQYFARPKWVRKPLPQTSQRRSSFGLRMACSSFGCRGSTARRNHRQSRLPAFLESFAVAKLMKQHSVNLAFSVLIFFSIGTYITYVAALKQCFAMFFLLMSIPYAEEKKYVRFYFLVAIAILFHTHAFMFAILPILFNKPWGKVTWLGLAVALFAMATYDSTLGAFMNYAQSIGALVDQDELFDGHQINALRVMVYWIPSILALVFRRRLFHDSTRYENLFVNMSIVSSIILMIGLVQGANLYARMAAYFEIATALALPWMIKKLFNTRSAGMVTVCAVVLYFGYFLYEFGVSKNFGSDYSAISLWHFLHELAGL